MMTWQNWTWIWMACAFASFLPFSNEGDFE
jgi:hypothetical protein